MAQFASILVFALALILFAALNGQSQAEVTVTVNTMSKYTESGGGGTYQIAVNNTGPGAVCGAQFLLTLPNGTTMVDVWNMVPMNWNMWTISQWTLPAWANIPPGGQLIKSGFSVTGTGQPTVQMVSSFSCNGSTPVSSAFAGGVTVSVNDVNRKRDDGSEVYQIVVNNSTPAAICGANYTLTMPSGAKMTDSFYQIPMGNGKFAFPSWAKFPAGGQITVPGTGFTVNGGNGQPKVSNVSTNSC